MRYFLLLWRRVTQAHQRSTFLCILLINVLIYLIGKQYYAEMYVEGVIIRNTTRSQRFEEQELNFSNLLEEFNWKSEAKSLVNAIPVLTLNKMSKQDNSKHVKTITFDQSDVLDLIPNRAKYNETEVVALLQKTYNPPLKNGSIGDATDVYNSFEIFNCDDIEYLENRTFNPQLTYPVDTTFLKRGELRLNNGYTVNVLKKFYRRIDFENPQDFIDILENFHKFLKTQGWPGIPRIYGACLLTADKKDATQVKNKRIPIEYLSYLLDRYDDGISICNEEIATDDCVKLNGLRKRIKKSPNSAVTSLKIMRGIGETFETLWRNGVFPYEFRMNDLVITKDLELVFTNLDSFIFLDESLEDPFVFTRALSSTMCKTWQSCPVPWWRNTHFLFRLGQPCKEVKGHCDENNRCWGMDALVHLCAFSKWIFHQLSMLIPISWKHSREVNNLLICTGHSVPEHRCDWTTFVKGVDVLLKLAEETWPTKKGPLKRK